MLRLFFFIKALLQCNSQLVGTTCAFAFAVYAFQTLYCLINIHSSDKGSHTLRITVATSDKINVRYGFAVQFHVYKLRTCTLRFVCQLFHIIFCVFFSI